jgi:LmbE family N-acetylglucosaminyl deacetylase
MDFSGYVDQIESLYLSGLPSQSKESHSTIPALSEALGSVLRRILIISPHPDDECLMSGLALRAKEEFKTEVGVLPYGFGSDPLRQEERKKEWKRSLQVLGFKEVLIFGDSIEATLLHFNPDAILIPHLRDVHPTHICCSKESWEAAKAMVSKSKTPLLVLESEYWGQIERPNLLIPLAASTVKKMGTALLCHQGEVERNPYHLSLPAFLMDQQRRGSELVAGFGGKPAPSVFAQLYRSTLLSPEVES